MAFATSDDLRIRLGLSTLSAEQTEQADQLLDGVSAEVRVAAGRKHVDALETHAPSHPALTVCKNVTLRVAARMWPNRSDVTQQTIGDYSVSYGSNTGGAGLTEADRDALRDAFQRHLQSVALGSADTTT